MYILIKHVEGCWPKLIEKDENLNRLVEELVNDVKKEVESNGCEFDSKSDDGGDYTIYRPDGDKNFGESIARASFCSTDISVDWAIFDMDAPKSPRKLYKIYRAIMDKQGTLINAGYVSSQTYQSKKEAYTIARALAKASANYQRALLTATYGNTVTAVMVEGAPDDGYDYAVRKYEDSNYICEAYYVEESSIQEEK